VHSSGRRGSQAKKADQGHVRQWNTGEQIFSACLEFSGIDDDALRTFYNVCAKEIVDGTMMNPGKGVIEAVDLARESGTSVGKSGRPVR
jgi:hypothetical protein